MSSKEKEVGSEKFFIYEKLPAGNYTRLQLPSLGAAYSTEPMFKKQEDGEQNLFLGLDRIMTLASLGPKKLVHLVTNARWLPKEVFIGAYDGVLKEHFLNICNQKTNVFKAAIHRVYAVVKVICNCKSLDSLRLRFPISAKKLMQLSRVCIFRDDPDLEPPMTSPQKLRLLVKLREEMSIVWQFFHDGDSGNGDISNQVQTVLEMVGTIKRIPCSASISSDKFLRFARAKELPDIILELRKIIASMQAKHVHPTAVKARTMHSSMRTACNGSLLTDSELNSVTNQLRDACGPAHVHIYEADLLFQIFGWVILSYPHG